MRLQNVTFFCSYFKAVVLNWWILATISVREQLLLDRLNLCDSAMVALYWSLNFAYIIIYILHSNVGQDSGQQ